MTKQQDLLSSYIKIRRHWRRWFACGLAVFLGGLFLLTTRVLDWIESRTRQDTINALQTVLTETHALTDLWVNGLYKQARMWVRHPKTVQLTQQLKRSNTGNFETLKSHPSQPKLKSILKQRSMHHVLHALQIVGMDGMIWVDLDETRVGVKHLVPSRFPSVWEDVKKGNNRATPPVSSPYSYDLHDDREHRDRPTIFLLSPILNKENESIAVMIFAIDPYEEFFPVIQLGRIGQSGNTYAIDKSGRFITPGRFTEDLHHLGLVDPDEPAIFNLESRDPGTPLSPEIAHSSQRNTWPLTEPASNVIKEEKGVSLSGTRDYRGIRVLSAWEWDPHLEMGLITEINEHEALASYEQTSIAILLLVGTVLGLLGIIVFVLNRYVGINKNSKLTAEAIHLAKASEEKFQSIFENVVEGIVCINAHGRILEFNKAAESIFGYQAAETIGQNVSMLMPEPDKGQHDQYLHRYRQTGTKHIMGGYREVIGRRKDGAAFEMELALGEFNDAKQKFFVGLVRDISERKETETLLITALEKAEAANQAKSHFLSRMSHELRTPLNGILGFSTLLSMDDLSPKNRKNIDRIQHSGKHLLTMINEIMSISNLDHHQHEMQLEPVSLKPVFDKVFAAMNPMALEKKVHFDIEDLPDENLTVWAHQDSLPQAIGNLISNGIKYNEPNGSVTVITELLENNRAKIRIVDTGIGIPESKIERLFSPFDRLDAEREKSHIEGSGLGLTLAKSLVEAMKGTISVKSQEGKGSEFSIELESAA